MAKDKANAEQTGDPANQTASAADITAAQEALAAAEKQLADDRAALEDAARQLSAREESLLGREQSLAASPQVNSDRSAKLPRLYVCEIEGVLGGPQYVAINPELDEKGDEAEVVRRALLQIGATSTSRPAKVSRVPILAAD